MAIDVHHFRPLITYSSPSRTMLDSIFVASLDATAGSVMPKQERISPKMFAQYRSLYFNIVRSPSRRGVSHWACCSGVPYFIKTSMFPVSGGEQLKGSEPRSERPISSAIKAYSRFVRPFPHFISGSVSNGTYRFQRPAAFALNRKSEPEIRNKSYLSFELFNFGNNIPTVRWVMFVFGINMFDWDNFFLNKFFNIIIQFLGIWTKLTWVRNEFSMLSGVKY